MAKTDLFDHAAFYGGTALRIFHGLDCFSEDLDFSLMESNPEFELNTYYDELVEHLNTYGIDTQVRTITKRNLTSIQTAIIQGNMRDIMSCLEFSDGVLNSIHRDEMMRIKFEIDLDPPSFASYEWKILDSTGSSVRLYDLPSLFAGKSGAVLTRGWKNRVKGRIYSILNST